MQNFKNILVFTDGACSGNPGKGGWGAIVCWPEGRVIELGGYDKQTTNNRMEMLAIIKAIDTIGEDERGVDIYTDSTYVIRGITQWIFGWMKRGWKNAQGEEVKNKELWQWLNRVVRGYKGKINWHYVRGHQGVPGNERVDEIAVIYTKGQRPHLYEGSLIEYGVAIHDIPDDSSLPEMKSKSSKKAKAYSYLSYVDGKLEKHKSWPECEARVKGRSGAKFKKALSKEDEDAIIRSWHLS